MKTKSRKLKFIVPFLALGLFVTGCSESKTNKNTSSTSTNPITGTNPTFPSTTGGTGGGTTGGGTGGGSGSSCPWGNGAEPGVADSGQSIEYYKLNSQPQMAVAKGASFGTVVFSSDSDLPGYNQNAFFSDSRFNVRVIPRFQNGGTTSKGQSCNFSPSPFTKMNIGIIVRARSSAPGVGDYYQFKDVPVNCASKIHQFQVPSTSDPLVIDVMNVEWDYSCIQDQNTNGSTRFCPYTTVWTTECYGVEIQFSTDTTKDIPGTRTYQ